MCALQDCKYHLVVKLMHFINATCVTSRNFISIETSHIAIQNNRYWLWDDMKLLFPGNSGLNATYVVIMVERTFGKCFHMWNLRLDMEIYRNNTNECIEQGIFIASLMYFTIGWTLLHGAAVSLHRLPTCRTQATSEWKQKQELG